MSEGWTEQNKRIAQKIIDLLEAQIKDANPFNDPPFVEKEI